MGTGKTENLGEGLSIYKRSETKNWYCKIRIFDEKSKPIWRQFSLKTADKHEARRKAYGYLAVIEDGKNPDFLMPKHTLVKTLCKEKAKLLLADDKIGTHKVYASILTDELAPMWGAMKIKEVTRTDIKNYIKNRVKSTTQFNYRKTAIRELFLHAVDQNLIKEHELPSFPAKKDVGVEPDEERDIFEDDDLKLINSKFPSFIESSRKSITKKQRIILKYYLQFLMETGVRPGEEALNIRISDFRFAHPEELMVTEAMAAKLEDKIESTRTAFQSMHDDYISELIKSGIDMSHVEKKEFVVTGDADESTHRLDMIVRITKGKIHSKKKTSFREAVLTSKAISAVNNLLSEVHNWKYGVGTLINHPQKNGELRELLNTKVFLAPECQNTMTQYEKTFTQLCDYIKLSRKDRFLTLYSSRHTYITNCLKKRVPITFLAVQCGTSVEMIQQRYSKYQASMTPSEITSRME